MSTRLPGARYRRIFDRGRSVKGRLLVAWHLESPDADRRAGVVVSKKSFHDAVDRNRAKRLMREAFRLLVKAGEMPERTEWVFIARSAIGGKKVGDVMAEMRGLRGLKDRAVRTEKRGPKDGADRAEQHGPKDSADWAEKRGE